MLSNDEVSELIEKYALAQEYFICETSGNIGKDLEKLEAEISEYKKKLTK